MTVEERKLELFRLAAQLVSNDTTLRAAAAAVLKTTSAPDYAAPDPYAPALARRAASEGQTPAQARRAFTDDYQKARLAEVEADRAALDADMPRLTTAELSAYEAPDPYREGLRALRVKENR